jgi:hypothetical protein
MALVTLQELRTRVRQRANMENSQFVTDAELNVYINEAIADLRDKMISKVGEDYFAADTLITLVSNVEAYALPADFYKILYVEVKGDDGYYYKMRRFEVSERNFGASPINYYIPDIRYRLRANQIVFTPQNLLGGRVVRLTYVPIPQELTANSDTLQGYNGWESYVIVYAARKALVKEESDTSQLDQELIKLDQRMEAMIDNRDTSEPSRIYDNSRRRDLNRWGR